MSRVQRHIDRNAWGGRFPSQVRVTWSNVKSLSNDQNTLEVFRRDRRKLILTEEEATSVLGKFKSQGKRVVLNT